MADRYWVGGAASWDGTAGTKWSTTNGGAGGASVPTSADDVFFTSLSTGPVTISAGNTGAKSISCTGFTGVLTGSSAISVAGSVTLDAAMVFSYVGTMTFTGTGTLISAGKSFGPITVDGSGITLTLGDALDTTLYQIQITQGTFNTANYNLTCSSIASINSNIRAINLGSSVVSLRGFVDFSTSTNLTFDAGTSSISLSDANAAIRGGGKTFYDVAFTRATTLTRVVTGANTFNNFSITGPSSAGVAQLTFDSPQTINGTLSTTGIAGNRRVVFRSDTLGLARTLTINSAPSLTDADFQDIYVIGTAAPITGTRIGDQRGCRGITFSAPKTVYWSLAGGGPWGSNAWATTSGGTPSTDNFPLPQDTAVIDNNSVPASGSISYQSGLVLGTIDMSGRTSALTLTTSANTIYGNFISGTGVTYTNAFALTFSGRNTQTITSAGRTFSFPITIDSYGGTVELADALTLGSGTTFTVTNGTFDTKGYAVTTVTFSSNNSNVRAVYLRSSTVSLGSSFNASTSTNLTFDCGTSTINITGNGSVNLNGGTGLIFYNAQFTGTSISPTISGQNTFNNVSILPPSSAGISTLNLSANQTINGTLTVAGASAVRRIFVRSDTIGTQRTLTVNNLVADDCDFRDIVIAGAAAGAAPTRAGNCGGNSGITFPAPKTVYWNLAGSQNWSATAWATTSSGTPDVNNFPLAQDTVVFDNAGAAGTISFNTAWNIGTLDASARTNAMTLDASSGPAFYGNLTFGSGVTTSGAATIYFLKNGLQTVNSNGVIIGYPIIISHPACTVQLADALSVGSNSQFLISAGTFDAVSYNVTAGSFNFSSSPTIKMGSGTWTATSTGTIWSNSSSTVIDPGTATIVLSDTSTTARTFAGGSKYYHKLIIGGATGTSTLTITGDNTFGELASTKTVAHTIALGTTTQTVGKWSVSGSVGNVVTLTGSVTSQHVLAGPATSGIDFLAMGSIGFSGLSPGEFYAGANSTGTATAPVFRVATPTPRTLYWVGGTGNWSNTARWSLSSGGPGGESVPTSLDNVIFNSASNATAYTVTIDVIARCNNFTMAGPASGNVTWAGTAALVCHGGFTLAATGVTRSYSGAITLSGTGAGKTFTTNGVVFTSSLLTINGIGAEWSLGSSYSTGSSIAVTNGTFNTAGFSVSGSQISSTGTSKRAIRFSSSTLTLSGSPIAFGASNQPAITLDFDAGTSQINCTSTALTFDGNGKTFYNVAFTSNAITSAAFTGANTFNNLSFTGRTTFGITAVTFSANQIISGTLTLAAGSDATCRRFLTSNTLGTQRTLTVNTLAAGAADVDYRDIVIAGAASPISGARFGDCRGNSGIVFDAPKTVYWNLAAGGNWGGSNGWAATAGGTPSVNSFPLAQDTAIFQSTGLSTGSTVTISSNYNIGTIDMSARTASTMTLDTISTTPAVYGSWINGSGVTLTGTGQMAFAGRTAQTITSAGKTFTQRLDINSPGGSVTLQDAATFSSGTSNVITLTQGTLDANGYNVTFTSTSSVTQFGTASSGILPKVLAIGSGTWTLAGSGTPWNISGSNFTITGTGIIRLTSTSAKTFAGGGVNYSGITLDQAGAGALTLTGNNRFKDITCSSRAATIIAFGSTIQVLDRLTLSGTPGNILSLTGTSASSPATLVCTQAQIPRATNTRADYLNISNVRGYPLETTWYTGTNSTNGGTLGWYFDDTLKAAVRKTGGFTNLLV